MRRAAIAIGILVVALPVVALAQGPFGITTPEPGGGAAWAGPLEPLFNRIAAWQSDFYQRLTDAIGVLKENGGAIWLLAGVSFLYGIFHAAGPGHGKAVISAYVLASGETLRRGVAISFAAAFLQAVTAIVLVSILAGILEVTAMTMTETTDTLEVGSYALITLVGGWLLWSRIRGGHHHHHRPSRNAEVSHPADAPHLHSSGETSAGAATATIGHSDAFIAPAPLNEPRPDHDHHDGVAHDHSHAPDPRLMAQPLTLRSAWAAILAVGIRPCSGAVIVLVFALAQGLFAAGIGATFVMAIGTAITVSLLATLAVLARDFALRLTGGGQRLAIVLRIVEITAAIAIVVLGLLLLGGALSR